MSETSINDSGQPSSLGEIIATLRQNPELLRREIERINTDSEYRNQVLAAAGELHTTLTRTAEQTEQLAESIEQRVERLRKNTEGCLEVVRGVNESLG